MTTIEKSEIRKTIVLLRAEVERLELLVEANDGDPRRTPFDPRTDTPPVVPKVKGTEDEMNWCTLLLFTGLLAHEVEHGRGATDDEGRKIAAAAGYVTGNNAWNGWAPASSQWDAGLRTINVEGLHKVQRCYDRVDRKLPEDLAAAIASRLP